jgi:hypothetical protein
LRALSQKYLLRWSLSSGSAIREAQGKIWREMVRLKRPSFEDDHVATRSPSKSFQDRRSDIARFHLATIGTALGF